jgi:membrane associated rhomboid family serine protease
MASDRSLAHLDELLSQERYREVLRLLDGDLRARLDREDALAVRGEALCGLAEFDEATACANEALAADPRHARAHYVLGSVAAALARPQDAVKPLINATVLDPGFAAAHHRLGLLYLSAGHVELAEPELRLAARLDPSSWRFAASLSRLAPSGVRFQALRAALRQGLRERPGSIRLRFRLAATYATAPLSRLVGDSPRVDPRISFEAYQRVMLRLPVVTYTLLIVNLVVLLWLESHGGSADVTVLNRYGAENPFAIVHQHEYWRLVTPIFLHAGWPHLLVNSMSLYFVGTLYERFVGRLRFLAVYFVAGVGGNVLSLAALPDIGVGASGAIFGIFGALGVFAFANRGVLGVISRRLVGSVVGLSVLNLLLPLADPNIDGWAHFGGLLYGAIAGLAVGPLLSAANAATPERLLDDRRGPATVLIAIGLVALAVMLLGVWTVWIDPSGA